MSKCSSNPSDISESNRAAVQARLAHRERCTELASVIVAHLIDARALCLEAEAEHAAAARCVDGRAFVARSAYQASAKCAEVKSQQHVSAVLSTMRRLLVITMASEDPSLSGHAEGMSAADVHAFVALMGADAE